MATEGGPAIESRPLSQDFDTASKKIHRKSHNLVNARLIVLFTNKKLYGLALACFYHVVKALESALAANSTHKDIRFLRQPLTDGLLRTQGFEKDLEYYLGPHWKQVIGPPTAAVQVYLDHIEHLSNTQPTLLLAHVYTQHLALASGGQIIKRWARKQMKLPPDQGTGAFDMDNPSLLKVNFQKLFNELAQGMSPETRQQMVDEHCKAFQFNNAIITQFRLGYWNFWAGLFLMLPPLTRISLLMLACSLLTLWYTQRKVAAAQAGAGAAAAATTDNFSY